MKLIFALLYCLFISTSAQAETTAPSNDQPAASNSASRDIASVIPNPPVTPPPFTKKADDEDVAALVALFKGFSLKGSLDAYYEYNANTPPLLTSAPTTSATGVQNKYHVFDMYHDDLQLSYAHLQIQKISGPVTATLDLGYGPAMQVVSGTKTDSSQLNVKQAIIGYKPIESLNIEVGRFVTYLGFETIESQDNWNYSRGVMYGYFAPVWHQGLKATYQVSNQVSVMGVVADGWNNSYADKRQKTAGAQVAYTPSDRASFYFSAISGQDYVASNLDATTPVANKTLYDFVGVVKATDKLSFALDSAYFKQSHYDAFALAGYARYQITERWASAFRAEYANDRDNLAFGETLASGQKVSTYTLTIENKLSPGLLLRLEGRADKSSQDVFTRDHTPVSSQTSGILGLVLSF